jgi:patatin-like phospholipase/acyl hydrolase
VKVLSIDGGGIRGIIPSMVLKEIEGRTQRPVSELFDLIVGTSTGGLIALALAKPGSSGEPAYDAKSLIGFYESEGERIFHIPIWKRVESGWNLLDEKYPPKGLEKVLNEFLGQTRLKEALVPVMIPAYEIESRMPWFFRSERAKFSQSYDFPMKDVARAAAAAPTYFPPKKLVTEGGGDYYSLIDGGVYANNPGMCAFVEARMMFPEDSDMLMVSLGTGELTRRIDHDDAEDWGLAQWAHPLLNVMFDGQSDTVDFQLQKLLFPPGRGRRYYRFQTRLDSGNDDLDDPRPGNLRSLRKEAKEMIGTHLEDLANLSKLLLGEEEL